MYLSNEQEHFWYVAAIEQHAPHLRSSSMHHTCDRAPEVSRGKTCHKTASAIKHDIKGVSCMKGVSCGECSRRQTFFRRHTRLVRWQPHVTCEKAGRRDTLVTTK